MRVDFLHSKIIEVVIVYDLLYRLSFHVVHNGYSVDILVTKTNTVIGFGLRNLLAPMSIPFPVPTVVRGLASSWSGIRGSARWPSRSRRRCRPQRRCYPS